MENSRIEVAALVQAEAERIMNRTAEGFARVAVIGSSPEDFKAHRANLDKIHALALQIRRGGR